MKFSLLIVLGFCAVQAQRSQVLKDFSVGYKQFTIDVYKELTKTYRENFLVSPLSLEVILALATTGAKGRTATQLYAGLHLPEDNEKIKRIFRELEYPISNNNNKIYLKDEYKINHEFKNSAIEFFKSDIQNINFDEKIEAVHEMNKWIEEKTEDKLKNVINEDDLDEGTQTILLNALYFHGMWQTKFNEEDTKKGVFHLNNQVDIQTDMMQVTNEFVYYESSELKAQFLELPYDGFDIIMNIVLPNTIEGLPDLEARINEVLAVSKYQTQRVHVVIPKFKLESKIQFKSILQALGIEDAFENVADFSGLTDASTKISKIIQQTVIEVDEKGTTAPMTTADFYETTAEHSTIKEFIADHPFIFYLQSSAGILFIGRYVQE